VKEPRMRRRFALAALIALGGGLTVYADNWPQWRGPQLDGTSRESGLPTSWSQTENIAWKTALPMRSGATPIVWRDHVFLNVAEAGDLFLWALDRNTGAVRWKQKMGGGDQNMRKQNMSSPSPVTDGAMVWAMTGTGVLKAFTYDGKEVWARDVQKEYGQFGLNWGYASSPLLLDGALYVQVLHGMKTDDPSYVMRVDAKTGKTVWRQERPTNAIAEAPDAYTTPVPLKTGNRTEIVVSGGDIVTAHDPATGKELWRSDGLNPTNHQWHRIVASPVVSGTTVYAPSRVKPLLAIKGGGAGNVTDSHRLWSFENGPDVPTPVTDGTYFYSFDDRGVVYCLDAKSGKPVYGPVRIKPGTYSASPILGDGKIYITSEEGLTTVVKAGPSFEVLAENNIGEYVLSSIAISDGQLFLRGDKHLYAIGQRKK
jgi:outer membrane protein assembly factor BamB